MTVAELMEKLKDADPERTVVFCKSAIGNDYEVITGTTEDTLGSANVECVVLF